MGSFNWLPVSSSASTFTCLFSARIKTGILKKFSASPSFEGRQNLLQLPKRLLAPEDTLPQVLVDGDANTIKTGYGSCMKKEDDSEHQPAQHEGG